MRVFTSASPRPYLNSHVAEDGTSDSLGHMRVYLLSGLNRALHVLHVLRVSCAREPPGSLARLLARLRGTHSQALKALHERHLGRRRRAQARRGDVDTFHRRNAACTDVNAARAGENFAIAALAITTTVASARAPTCVSIREQCLATHLVLTESIAAVFVRVFGAFGLGVPASCGTSVPCCAATAHVFQARLQSEDRRTPLLHLLGDGIES